MQIKSNFSFKLIIFLVFFVFTNVPLFSISFYLDGNAHIFQRNDLQSLYQMKKSGKLKVLTPENLYDAYGEKIRTDLKNSVIAIKGYVCNVRTSIYGEYILELYLDRNTPFNVCVVFPKKISQAMLSELKSYHWDDYVEFIVATRDWYQYVDVVVWNSNGTYRTEP